MLWKDQISLVVYVWSKGIPCSSIFIQAELLYNFMEPQPFVISKIIIIFDEPWNILGFLSNENINTSYWMNSCWIKVISFVHELMHPLEVGNPVVSALLCRGLSLRGLWETLKLIFYFCTQGITCMRILDRNVKWRKFDRIYVINENLLYLINIFHITLDNIEL